ncbi:Two component regulator three Y domain-containing protein [uncultured Kriegella sp.]|uniref:helix-turn-helix and ligand-binding sensor domain-containing protein n=1 Tax=uncultured Kriegella sp. TaxID=1798910 RepID=UPI0030D95F34|tara:strand:+ start:37515 stop:40271 length:2757 start_codon:yes stop_codon:yes gene_type:complete
MKFYLGCIFFFVSVTSSLWGQDLLPPIYNHKIFEYNAASQNWGVTVNQNGELFVANSQGLLYYNGEEWILNRLPNNTIVRSVVSIGNKIYTGSYEEFGYWTKNQVGLFEYTSLTHLIEDHEFTNEEFWQIVPFGDAIIFRSFSTIYHYKNNRITVWDTDQVITNVTIHNNEVLVSASNIGLFRFQNEKLVPVNDNALLTNKAVIDVIPFQDGLLVGTKLHGCFLLKDGKFTVWDEEINNVLRQYQLNKMLPLDSGEIAFGTIKNGIYLYHQKNKKTKNLNRETGLQNNTVLSMTQFKEQLWVGLDNGLDRIRINTPLSYFTDHSGALGTVYDMAINDSVLYLGSNTGIYFFENNALRFVEGSQGHVWDLETMDGDLLAGHNTGTFKVRGDVLEKISPIAGGYQWVRVPEQQNTFLQGTYTGIAKYTRDSNTSWRVDRIKKISFPVKQLCFEDDYVLWGAHPYKGLFRFKLNETYDEIIETQEFGPDVIPNDYNIKLYNIKNQIVVQSEGTWYKYDPILKKIAIFKEFEPYNFEELISHNGDFFWFNDNEGDKEISFTDLKDNTIFISEPNLQERLVPDAKNIFALNDSIYYLTLSDGFARINLSQLNETLDRFSLPTPTLQYFKDKEHSYDINVEHIEIPFGRSQDIVLQIAAPSLIRPRYYYELSGAKTQSSYLDKGAITFQNLPHGDYLLSIFTVGMNNKKSSPKLVSFEITPPWYLSKVSLVVYFLAFVGLILLVRLYNRRKLERRHNKLKQQLERERAEHIANLEKEKLAKEIRLKQKELASTTMNMAKKNQLILELKNILLMNKDKFGSQQRYRSFMKKLEGSINEDKDWKNFELNFKELHDDFFENLLSQFPNLTPKDLKLCAYLKMNLSSKEIAPLMAITIRGVEIHRYRLRKKLGIDSSQNLSNFLIKFK